MTKQEPVLRIKDLHFSYQDGESVLKGINAELFPGQIVGLIGPNGSGKTTLARLVSGQLEPQSGYIEFHKATKGQSENIVLLAEQNLSLYENLPVAYNICIGDFARKADLAIVSRSELERKATRCMEKLGADLPLWIPVSALTFAQKQLVEISKAIYRTPQILILDEPTSALDNTSKSRLFHLLKRLASTGTSIVFVTHDWSDLTGLATDILTIRDGCSVRLDISEYILESSRPQILYNKELSVGNDLEYYVRLKDTGTSLRFGTKQGTVRVYGFEDAWERGTAALALTGLNGHHVSMTCDRKPIDPKPVVMRQHGIRLLLGDRKRFGIFPELPVLDTCIILGDIALPFFNRNQTIHKVSTELDDALVKYRSLSAPSYSLSGGNQQKLLWACLKMSKPKFLVVEEPLLGLDKEAQAKIRTDLADLADKGTGVLIMTCYPHLYSEWQATCPTHH
jgi:ABC-type sugar transport system ATPase subunit